MSSLAIDTLRYSKRLRAVGFSEEQAEVQAEALSEAIRDTLVTKTDLTDAAEKLHAKIDRSSLELRSEIEKSVSNLRVEIREAQSVLIRWLIPLMLGQLAAMAALVKLL